MPMGPRLSVLVRTADSKGRMETWYPYKVGKLLLQMMMMNLLFLGKSENRSRETRPVMSYTGCLPELVNKSLLSWFKKPQRS